jgi:hypothetical protein
MAASSDVVSPRASQGALESREVTAFRSERLRLGGLPLGGPDWSRWLHVAVHTSHARQLGRCAALS